MFDDGTRRRTWTGDPVIVEAMDAREGEVSDWDTHFLLEADGWPEAVPSPSGPKSMAWARRHQAGTTG